MSMGFMPDSDCADFDDCTWGAGCFTFALVEDELVPDEILRRARDFDLRS